MHRKHRTSIPRHYPLTDEDLKDIERGAPNTSASSLLLIIALVVIGSILLFK
jgi:hypothetical protein